MTNVGERTRRRWIDDCFTRARVMRAISIPLVPRRRSGTCDGVNAEPQFPAHSAAAASASEDGRGNQHVDMRYAMGRTWTTAGDIRRSRKNRGVPPRSRHGNGDRPGSKIAQAA